MNGLSDYQVMYYRFLRMKQEFPHLNHIGHEPSFHGMDESESLFCISGMHYLRDAEKQRAEREFYRPVEKKVCEHPDSRNLIANQESDEE